MTGLNNVVTTAPSSKPAYFEFLLKPSMLEEHLEQADPDPNAIDLMIQMVYNSLKRPASEQSIGSINDVELMQRKGHMLVVLPLRILAHLNYDMQLLLDKTPLEICDALLNYLLGECLGPLAAELVSAAGNLDLATLLPHQVLAASVYLRYVLAAVVESRVPHPPQHRTTPLSLHSVCGDGSEQREDRDALLAELSGKADYAARILDALVVGATQVCAPLSSSYSLAVPPHASLKGTTHNFSNCSPVPLQHWQCQVHYDLGQFYFVTERYSDALHHLTQATALLGEVTEMSVYCRVSPASLHAHTNTCMAVCGRSTPLHRRTLLDRFMNAIRQPGYQGVLEVLTEDDLSQVLPRYLRHKLQVDLMAAPPHTTSQGLCFQVCCHNVVRNVLEDRAWEPSFPGHLTTAGRQGSLYLLQLLSDALPHLTPRQRQLVRTLLLTLSLQEEDGVGGTLPPLPPTAPLAALLTHQERLDMWHGREEENQAKLLRQAMDVNYGVESGDDASLVWELLHCHEPVALRRAVTRYVTTTSQQQARHHSNDILDLNDKWEVPIAIRNTLVKIPSKLHRFLVSIFVAKSQELLLSKSWAESCDLLDAALKACGEVADGEWNNGSRLYKMLTWLKLSHNIRKWIHALPHTDDGGSALASEAKLCLMALSGREDVVPWTSVINGCVVCLVNARDWAGLLATLSGLQLPSSYLPLLSLLRPLLAAAHILDSASPPPLHRPPEPPFAHLWDAVVGILDTAAAVRRAGHQHASGGVGSKATSSGGGGGVSAGGVASNGGAAAGGDAALSLQEFLALVQDLKEPVCLSLLTSLLGTVYNRVLMEPSAEMHTLYPQLWADDLPAPAKDTDLTTVREALSTAVQHAITTFPGADHVSESTVTSWHVTAADLAYNSNNSSGDDDHRHQQGQQQQPQHNTALRHYLTAVFVATNCLRSDPPDDATAALVGDTVLRKMVRCCMSIGCYTQAGLLCQFLCPIDYSTALRCLQDRSGVDGMDAYYHCLCDVTLMEFIINAHHKRGEVQRRDAVLRLIGQLELNSNNNEEIQREAAKVRKHRLLRALAKQYLT